MLQPTMKVDISFKLPFSSNFEMKPVNMLFTSAEYRAKRVMINNVRIQASCPLSASVSPWIINGNVIAKMINKVVKVTMPHFKGMTFAHFMATN